MTLVANGRVHDLYGDDRALATILDATAGIQFDRQHKGRATWALAKGLARQPVATLRLIPWAARRLWAMRQDLVAARGRVHKLSFFIHNFMDAEHLACDRIESCVFMVATGEGPISMCLHNAKRDAYILKPVALSEGGYWNPLTGTRTAEPVAVVPVLTRKTARGRRRYEINHQRAAAQPAAE
jgi:hypothetical protein